MMIASTVLGVPAHRSILELFAPAPVLYRLTGPVAAAVLQQIATNDLPRHIVTFPFSFPSDSHSSQVAAGLDLAVAERGLKAAA